MLDEENEQLRRDVEDDRTVILRPPHADYYGEEVFNYNEPPDVRRSVPQGCAWCLVSALLCIGSIIAWLMR